MVIAASAFAVINEPITAQKIARDTGVDLSLIKAWVTHARSYEDGSGYLVFFKAETPAEVREQIPRLTTTNLLIVLAA
ncbi:hypothetical protein [Pseudomonas sp. PDM11]|uniref:hypothetical protein n=1 Tax=Pseudomonas sp. PDM11 TaxID=2769309 RepID=UPI0017842C31|nr:hypothetical protein [Pseudomonas sp. PDM11]MBD9397945.1 hypothetical protein [Pseudomonas sp. PDM11]